MNLVQSATLLPAQSPAVETSSPRTTATAFAAVLDKSVAVRSARDASTVVRTTRTQLSGSDAARALSQAWNQVFGAPPSERTVAVLTAQWAHETGRGAQMMNFNFGGIKGTGPTGLSAAYATREGWGASERRTVDSFRAYHTAEEGATDYVRMLARHYPEAAQAAKDGDPEQFVRALKARKYFTGNEEAYVKSVRGLTSQGLTAGFDAVGGGERVASAPARLDLPALELHRDFDVPINGADAGSGVAALEAEAVADEVGRAALHALVSRANADDFDPRNA